MSKKNFIIGLILILVAITAGFAAYSEASISNSYFDFSTRRIADLTDPASPQDIATKQYADAAAGTSSTYVMGSWSDTGSDLPGALAYSQVAIIGNYIYLFGGQSGGSAVNYIYRAATSNPTNWSYVSNLPTALSNPQVAVIGNYVYLFGGFTTTDVTNHVYRASVSDPLTWTDMGSKLPAALSNSQVAVIGSYIYLFGGYIGSNINTGHIYRASVSDPLTWVDTGSTIGPALDYSQVAVIGDYVYLFGGLQRGGTSYPRNSIYRASVSDPLTWTYVGIMGFAACESQVAVIGDSVFLFGGYTYNGSTWSDSNYIARFPVSNPAMAISGSFGLPVTLSNSQVAVIGNNIYLFGGYAAGALTANIYSAPITQASVSPASMPSWQYK